MTTAPDLDPLALLGTWHLDRVIVDRAADERSTVVGSTTLAEEGDGRVRWTEAGTLSRRGLELEVSRTLWVVPRDGGWFVTFEDGREFHPWAPGVPVEHVCSPDLYVGTVDRTSADRWTVEWQVSGPHKDYTMTSVLTRP